MLYHVRHTTTYEYSSPVSLCQNLAHLIPRDTPTQKCREAHLTITPQPAVESRRRDSFGNEAVFFSVQEPHLRLSVTVAHQVEVNPAPEPTLTDSPPWTEVRDQLKKERTPTSLEAYGYVFASRFVPPNRKVASYATASFTPNRPLLEAVRCLTQRIHTDFTYDPSTTTVATPIEEVFANRRGVCQDFAHLQISALRSLGLPARYVSGYLSTSPPPGQERLVGADATHAWLSVYCPGLGWVDFDPTNDQIPSDKHVLLAWGRDFDDVSPIKGVVLGGGDHTVKVAVDVIPDEEYRASLNVRKAPR